MTAIPLDERGLCYIQGRDQKNDGTLQTYPIALIGDLSAQLNPSPLGSIYVEIDGAGLDFHTGTATVAGLDYDARILVTGANTIAGGADMNIFSKNFNLNFTAGGALSLNGSVGTAGQVLTSQGAAAPYWGAGGGGPGTIPTLYEVLDNNNSAGDLGIDDCPSVNHTGLISIGGVGVELNTNGDGLYLNGSGGIAGQVLSSGGAGPPVWIDNAGVTPSLYEVLDNNNSAGQLGIEDCTSVTNINVPLTIGGVQLNLLTGGYPLTINNATGANAEYLQSQGAGLPPIWAPVVGTVPLGDITAPLGLTIDCSNGAAFCHILAGPITLGDTASNSYVEITPVGPSLDLLFHSNTGNPLGDVQFTIYPGDPLQPANAGSLNISAASVGTDQIIVSTATSGEVICNTYSPLDGTEPITIGTDLTHCLTIDTATTAGQSSLSLSTGDGGVFGVNDCKIVSIDRGNGQNDNELVLEAGAVRFTSGQTLTAENGNLTLAFETCPYNAVIKKNFTDDFDSTITLPNTPVDGWRLSIVCINVNHTMTFVTNPPNGGFRVWNNNNDFSPNNVIFGSNMGGELFSAGGLYWIQRSTTTSYIPP